MLFPGKATCTNSVWLKTQWWQTLPKYQTRRPLLLLPCLSQAPGLALLPTSSAGSSPASCFPDSHSPWMILSLTSHRWTQDSNFGTPLCPQNTLSSMKPSPALRVLVPNQSFNLAEPSPWKSLPNFYLLLGDLLRAYCFLQVPKSARTRVQEWVPQTQVYLCWRQWGWEWCSSLGRGDQTVLDKNQIKQRIVDP